MSKKDDRIDLIDQEGTFQPEYFYAVKDIFQSCKTPVAETKSKFGVGNQSSGCF